MKKIPTVYLRDWDGDPKYVTREINPEAAWVFTDQNVRATRKYDGTCVMFDGERWWARREVKPGKVAPANYVEISTDDETGKTVGWEPIEQSGFAKWLAEAIRNAGAPGVPWLCGTYELIGPKVNGNAEGCGKHLLVEHGRADRLSDVPLDYDGLAAWLHTHAYEGIVWHHRRDGRMAKLKKRDIPKAAS